MRPTRARAVGREQLDERTAGVVADQRDVVEVEPLEELGDQPRQPARREVGVGVHGVAVRAQRQRRGDAAVVAGELGDDVVPQRGVHQQAGQQHDAGPSPPVSWYSIVPADSSIRRVVVSRVIMRCMVAQRNQFR